MLKIREANASDSEAIWRIFHAVVARGDTYALDPATSREDALAYWLHAQNRCYVAESEGTILGTYIIKAHQSGPGSHVANAAFMVAATARNRGVGKRMGEHALNEARRRGFRAMQFNLVVSTNQSAVRLWQQLGFTTVGTLPGAFRHPDRGFVDALVMYRALIEP